MGVRFLNKFNKVKLRILPNFLILIVLFLLLLINSFSKNTFSVAEKNKEITRETKVSTASDIPTSSSTPTLTPTLTPTPTEIIQSSNSQSLLNAVNAFRSKNGLGQLSSNSTLCSIAQNRVNENAALGRLDDHAGFDKYFKGQTEFKGVGENLHWATYSETGAEIVENGWAKSTGHLANMLDPKWQYGCGRQTGRYFASFIFASK